MTPRGFARPLFALPALLVGAVLLTALTCARPTIQVLPADGAQILTPDFTISVHVEPTPASVSATLNGAPLALVGAGADWSVDLSPGAPLLDQNDLVVQVVGTNGLTYTRTSGFAYAPPKARARQITDAADLVTGPLAQGRVGDWLIENGTARYVIQDVGQRDLHSVGQFGGNVIDAELVGRPGRDQFFEMQPGLNIESVINAQSVEIVNDGQDGTPAVLRVCGPDDLIDYINPSSQIAELGVSIPNVLALIDDRDYEIYACTEYSLAPDARGLELETTVFNDETAEVGLYAGEFMNGMGPLEPWNRTNATPPAGLGEMLATPVTRLFGYMGFDDAEGVDYGLVPLDFPGGVPTGSSAFTTSGVSVLLHSHSVIFVLGFQSPPVFFVPAGGSNAFRSVFSVGDGSLANTLEIEAQSKGLAAGRLQGCVTVGGAPAPSARVAVGPIDTNTGRIKSVDSHFVTDASGCYGGTVLAGNWGVAAGRAGAPYQGGGALPTVNPVTITAGGVSTVDVALPATGRIDVTVTDEDGLAVPARVTVVGFDPSPEPTITTTILSPQDTTTGLFRDVTKDPMNPGLVALGFAGADGHVAFDLEPGSYQLYVSRGTEYSLYQTPITSTAGTTTNVSAQIARVLDTPGFVSSDFHVHMLNSPDSRISLERRAMSYAVEGTDNIISTDHDAHTDLLPTIASLGLSPFLHATIGEEITSFDYGHFNAYPQAIDPTRVSGGSTDWARAAPPGMDFPAYGAYGLTPAEIDAAATGNPLNAGLDTVVQVNHIDSHFAPLEIDTAAVPPQSFLTNPGFFRLDPSVTNFFHAFAALELWNGAGRGDQDNFLLERMGIWMNLLNQGIPTTAIGDSDSHTVVNLESAGARTWTAASSDAPASIDDPEIGRAVREGRAVGGQGIYAQTRLLKGAAVADLGLGGSTMLTATDGNVDLEIAVQAPTWAPYDTIEIYANATTTVAGTMNGTPVLYSALPTQTLTAGVDFTVSTVSVAPSVPGGDRLETLVTVPLSGLTEDTWVAVIVKGTSGVSPPMFPVYPRNVSLAGNATLADLVNVQAGEAGTRALGFTNALYVDVDGNGSFDAPGVRVAP